MQARRIGLFCERLFEIELTKSAGPQERISNKKWKLKWTFYYIIFEDRKQVERLCKPLLCGNCVYQIIHVFVNRIVYLQEYTRHRKEATISDKYIKYRIKILAKMPSIHMLWRSMCASDSSVTLTVENIDGYTRLLPYNHVFIDIFIQ